MGEEGHANYSTRPPGRGKSAKSLKKGPPGVYGRDPSADNVFAMTNDLLQMEPKPRIKTSAFERFNNVLKDMIEKGGSDLHATVGSGFRIRMLGELVPSSDPDPLAPGEIASIAGGS